MPEHRVEGNKHNYQGQKLEEQRGLYIHNLDEKIQ
jgi:hypothetical protein